jgi:hypothetical protein
MVLRACHTRVGTPEIRLKTERSDEQVGGIRAGRAGPWSTTVAITSSDDAIVKSYFKFHPEPLNPATTADETVPHIYELLVDSWTNAGAELIDDNGCSTRGQSYVGNVAKRWSSDSFTVQSKPSLANLVSG